MTEKINPWTEIIRQGERAAGEGYFPDTPSKEIGDGLFGMPTVPESWPTAEQLRESVKKEPDSREIGPRSIWNPSIL